MISLFPVAVMKISPVAMLILKHYMLMLIAFAC